MQVSFLSEKKVHQKSLYFSFSEKRLVAILNLVRNNSRSLGNYLMFALIGNCGWNPIDNAPEFIGEIVKPSMKRNSVCSGPDHDHTFESPNGHYMIFCLAPTAQVDKFLIKSVDFNSTNNYCFSFWAYFFNGKLQGKF